MTPISPGLDYIGYAFGNVAERGDIMEWLIALVVFLFGLTAWRREYVGRRRIELAEDVLSLFYEGRDAIQQIRSPMSYSHEGSTRPGLHDEKEEEREIRRQYFIPTERFTARKEVFYKIMSIRYRFIVLFGQEREKPFVDLNRIIMDILHSSSELERIELELLNSSVMEPSEKLRLEADRKEHREVIWTHGKNDNPVTDKVNTIVSEIEGICNNILKKETVTDKIYEWLRNRM